MYPCWSWCYFHWCDWISETTLVCYQ